MVRLTPKERPWSLLGLLLQIQSDSTHGLDGRSTGRIPGQHDVKVGEIALAQALVEVADLLGCCPGAFELSIAGVIT